MIIRSIFFAAFVLYFSISSAIKICDRKPTSISTPKSTNPHPFRIVFKGNIEYYTPGTTYTVLLQGIRTTATPSFTSFILMVESEESQNYDDENNDFISGKFQLTGDVRTKISEVCPNTVTQTSLIPKSEVQVFWTAPSSGSGCVVFRATIVEYRDIWYMDDDQLNKRICEESNESNDDNANVVYECCACHEAKFELTFEGLWSRHTHPKDYPDDNWQTRFSDVIGASHTIDYRFWEQDQVASDGMNSIAQSGTTSTLESELKSKSDKIRTIIKARGISYPNVTGKTFAVFRVDQDHHLISVVSFMYPSPDWFVGISGLELCLPNCNWITNKTINLYPWDAGIDSGVTYNSSDMPQVPIMNIERVWPSNINDMRSPFYDQSGAQMKPIAKLHLMRQRLYEKSCSEEESKTESAVCDTGPWSDWDECSVTCGKGYSNRYRQYKNPEDAHKPHCSKRSMTQRKGCYVLPSCAIESEETDTIDPKCDVTAFGQWSDCSAECGPGVTARFRTILNEEVTPKYCLGRMFLQQTIPCESKPCQDERDNVDLGIICSNCSLTKWSLWSPCNMKCGTGQKERHRMNLDRTAMSENCDPRCYTQTINCTDNPPCENNMRMEDILLFGNSFMLKKYNVTVQRSLIYNINQKTNRLCNTSIVNQTTISPSSENTPVTSVTLNPDDISDDSTEKCFLSNWSKFSSCNAICGPGFKERTRTILSPTDPLEQKKCRKKLVDRRNCRGRQCST
ncbi:spondin-1 isoform X4 [Metopolophium dirhodum]|uniref:spondin-1 isoform X4 n=1 Tax=Metopolophium dirhodum TaxID=44670 RepID=UPI00299025FA|nr:spondin-1 isoform X4 [Metopolophium dirhodum]